MDEQIELPKDTSLPFLVYGIFKPKKISKSIQSESKVFNFENMDFVENVVPLKTKKGNYYNDSYLIYFNKNNAKEAYESICKMESSKNVSWKKIKVGEIKTNVLVIEQDDSYYLNSKDLDTSLPFFAYGIFKKDQLAYSKIKKYVKGQPKEDFVDNEMLIRDGVPILTKNIDENYKANGNLIYFKDDCCDEAYEVISGTEPRKLYYWDVITVGKEDANVLFGKNPENGSSEFEVFGSEIKNYNGKYDPFFNESMKIIKEFLENPFNVNMRNLIELQMHYLLLWAAIERYCDLKYGKEKISENIEEFSKEDTVIECVKNLKNFSRYKTKTNVVRLRFFHCFFSHFY